MPHLDERALTKAKEMLPDYMVGGLVRYFNNHLPPGGFLRAVLAGDLFEALAHADDTNKNCLHAYAMWLHNYVPGRPQGWGSYEAIDQWLAIRGPRCSTCNKALDLYEYPGTVSTDGECKTCLETQEEPSDA